MHNNSLAIYGAGPLTPAIVKVLLVFVPFLLRSVESFNFTFGFTISAGQITINYFNLPM
jgi:hypothetical protein